MVLNPRNRQRSAFQTRGFSLIEVMVAISIFLIATTATLSIASQSISSARVSKDRITAFYLAQEAVEYVRNARDNNSIKGTNWLSGEISSCKNTPCTVDVNQKKIKNCGGSGCPPIKLSSQYVYNYKNGNDTIFVREVTINEITTDREAIIDVQVSWTRKKIPRTFTISEHIFNWKQ